MTTYDGDGFRAIEMLDTLSSHRGDGIAREAAQLIRAFHKDVVPGGWMYQVAIDVDPDTLLNWDDFLHNQSSYVQAAITRALQEQPGGSDLIWRNPGSGDEINLSAMDERERAITERTLKKLGYGKIAPRWQHILEVSSPRQMALGDDPVQASKTLLGAGIPGLYYLDGFSRRDGVGTRNYVMFDVTHVRVLRKYK